MLPVLNTEGSSGFGMAPMPPMPMHEHTHPHPRRLDAQFPFNRMEMHALEDLILMAAVLVLALLLLATRLLCRRIYSALERIYAYTPSSRHPCAVCGYTYTFLDDCDSTTRNGAGARAGDVHLTSMRTQIRVDYGFADELCPKTACFENQARDKSVELEEVLRYYSNGTHLEYPSSSSDIEDVHTPRGTTDSSDIEDNRTTISYDRDENNPFAEYLSER